MESKFINSFKLILVFIFALPLKALTVNPALCPTNKIAPHRRIASWDSGYQPRTFGAFYDLLVPGGAGQPYRPLNGLQEDPQKDDPDDCGDIEDYDENDLSSLVTPQRRYGRLLFSHLYNGYPTRPTANRPSRPERPGYPPTKPPYWSGGYFENNAYRPPQQYYPSDNIKPVHDGVQEPQTTYRPHLVGGPSGHVIGVSPVRPTYLSDDPQGQNNPAKPSQQHTNPLRPSQPQANPLRPSTSHINLARPSPSQSNTYPARPSQSQANPLRPSRPVTKPPRRDPAYVQFPNRATEAPLSYPTRRPRSRKTNDNIFGSFFDLLF